MSCGDFLALQRVFIRAFITRITLPGGIKKEDAAGMVLRINVGALIIRATPIQRPGFIQQRV